MTDWTAFTLLRDYLITYYFGSPLVFYTSVLLLFLLLFIMAGLDLRFAIVFTLPIAGAFALNGAFGAYTWIVNLVLLFVAIVYAYTILKLMT